MLSGRREERGSRKCKVHHIAERGKPGSWRSAKRLGFFFRLCEEVGYLWALSYFWIWQINVELLFKGGGRVCNLDNSGS